FHCHCLSSCIEPPDPSMLPWYTWLGAPVAALVVILLQTNERICCVTCIVPVRSSAVDDICGERHETIKAALAVPPSVENTGVEPVTSCMPCKRSSQLS